MSKSVPTEKLEFIINNGKTEEQSRALLDITMGKERTGFKIVKHLPGSSEFKYSGGGWNDYWINEKHTKIFPEPQKCDCCYRKPNKMSGCHVVDKNGKVYIYPACHQCNVDVIGNENDFPFYAKMDWLVPFRVEEVTCENHQKSPSALLKEAIAKISFD